MCWPSGLRSASVGTAQESIYRKVVTYGKYRDQLKVSSCRPHNSFILRLKHGGRGREWEHAPHTFYFMSVPLLKRRKEGRGDKYQPRDIELMRPGHVCSQNRCSRIARNLLYVNAIIPSEINATVIGT